MWQRILKFFGTKRGLTYIYINCRAINLVFMYLLTSFPNHRTQLAIITNVILNHRWNLAYADVYTDLLWEKILFVRWKVLLKWCCKTWRKKASPVILIVIVVHDRSNTVTIHIKIARFGTNYSCSIYAAPIIVDKTLKTMETYTWEVALSIFSSNT
jgi:hypothetical protein